jgi:hypothetical protein
MELHEVGWLTGRAHDVSDVLAQAFRAAGAMYEAGGIGPGRDLLAMNFLMDRSEESWTRELARLEGEAGACRTDAPIVATGTLTGRFTWKCEHAELEGTLLLAPTDPPKIQALRFRIEGR